MESLTPLQRAEIGLMISAEVQRKQGLNVKKYIRGDVFGETPRDLNKGSSWNGQDQQTYKGESLDPGIKSRIAAAVEKAQALCKKARSENRVINFAQTIREQLDQQPSRPKQPLDREQASQVAVQLCLQAREGGLDLGWEEALAMALGWHETPQKRKEKYAKLRPEQKREEAARLAVQEAARRRERGDRHVDFTTIFNECLAGM